MVNVVNKYKHTPCADDVYVGRGSPLGNPFHISDNSTRESVCEDYAEAFPNLIKQGKGKQAIETIIQRQLQGKITNLVCYCAPKQCHADTIKAYAEKELQRRLNAPIRLIIAGGRDFDDEDLMIEAITKISTDWKDEDVVIVSGMAGGADQLGYNLAYGNDIPTLNFPADWKDMSEPCVLRVGRYGEYNALAGMKRNGTMRDIGTHLLAFWNGKSTGTKDMINQATAAGLEVIVIRY